MAEERDPYEVTIELVRTVRDEQRIGFERIERKIDSHKVDRDKSCAGHQDRIVALEHWRARIDGTYKAVAAVGAFLGTILGALVSWLAGRHHQ